MTGFWTQLSIKFLQIFFHDGKSNHERHVKNSRIGHSSRFRIRCNLQDGGVDLFRFEDDEPAEWNRDLPLHPQIDRLENKYVNYHITKPTV